MYWEHLCFKDGAGRSLKCFGNQLTFNGDETLLPSWHLLKVFNDSLGSKVIMLEDALGVSVAWKDKRNVIHKDDVVLVDN